MRKLSYYMLFIALLQHTACQRARQIPDESKILLLDTIAMQAWNMRRVDPAQSDSLSDVVLMALDSFPDAVKTKAQALKNKAATQWIRGQFRQALPLADSALSLFEQAGDSTQTGNMYNLKGLIAWNAGTYEEALEYYGKAEEYFHLLSDTDGIMKVWNNTGIILYQTGDFEKAMGYFVKVLPYNESKGSSQALADNYTNMAIILEVQKDLANATRYKLKALEVSRETNDPKSEMQALANLGTLYYNAANYDSAISYDLMALPLAEQIGDKYTEAFILNNLAECALAKNYIAQAEAYLFKALEIRRQIEDPLGQAISLRIYGVIQENKGQFGKALDAYKDALALAKEINSKEQEMNCHEQMAYAYKSQKQIDQAFYHLQQYRSLKDSLFSEKQNAKIRELEFKYENSKKEAKLLEQQLQLKQSELSRAATKRNMWVMTGLGGLLLMIMGSLYLNAQRKRKLEKHLAKKDQEMLELSLKNEALQKEKLQQEVSYKNKEITTLALMMASKRSTIEELESQVAVLKGQPTEELPGKISTLLKELQIKRSMEKEMDEFDQYVHQVCEGFFERLQNLYPDITRTEKRLAALLRMELSSKEIASIMNISPKSVDMGRYRLRKKMNIDSEERLVNSLSRL